MKRNLVLLFAIFPIIANAFTGMVEIDGIYYNVITKAKTAEVTTISQHYYGEIGYYSGDVSIPPTIEYEGVICNVTSIQREAFLNCKNLTSIKLPNSIVSIGVAAFSGCDKLSSLEIPLNVSSIDGWAFRDCLNLKTIVLRDNVESIAVGAFENCSSLTSIIIPELVTVIDTELFNGCTNLASISWGNNVEQINPRAFMNCSSLKNISPIPNVSYIGQEAFSGCSSIVSIEISNSVTTIYDGTFSGCSNLQTFVMPEGISSIGKNAFQDCNNLVSVFIPASVTTIGEYAFGNCPEISDVYCYAVNPPKIETFTFLNSYPEYATLHVPENSIIYYKDKYPWGSFGNIVAISENVKCEMPTISYSKGKIIYTCATENVEFISDITDSDIKKYQSTEVDICATYQIRVYARKKGYNNSDVATATLCWIDEKPLTEGVSDVVSEIRALPVMVQSNNGIVRISGASKGLNIDIYNTSGIKVGSGMVTDNMFAIQTSLQKGDIAIVKIGNKSIKLLMQ